MTGLTSQGSFAEHFVKVDGPLVYGIGAALVVGVVVVFVAGLWHRRITQTGFDRAGVWCISGIFGGGKSYFMAWMARRAIEKGRPVFANYHVKGATYVSTWEEVMAVRDGALVLLDELHLWWPSDALLGPAGMESWLSNVRHHGITVLWASQHYSFVGTRFRKVTRGVWFGRGQAGGHEYTLYAGHNFNPSKPHGSGRLSRMRIRRTKAVMAMYDTHEDVVENLGWMDEVTKGRRRVDAS
jgi:hypothetical protein